MKLCAVVPLAWALACPQVWAAATTDVLTSVICASTEAAAYLGFHCSTSASSSSPSPTSTSSPSPPTTTRSTSTTETPTATTTPSPTVDKTATYSLHALAIGVRGVDLGLDSCCNRYRSTGVDNAEYYKDQQAQQNVAHLLSFSAKKLKPKVIIGHGDNFYWNGLGSDDVAYRFQNSFEAYYNQDSLIDVKWVNVAGNHDYGGAMFICGRWDNQIVECTSKADLLKQLDEKFTRQSGYKSPCNDRWQIPARCNNVGRGHPLCAGGDTDVFDACLAKLEEWPVDSLCQLFRDAKASTATWKVVNSHCSPHFHMAPPMMQEWNNVLAATGVHLFMNGHTHAESHEYGDFKTHFVTNGTSGGIQSESIGGPPDYATNVSTVWISHDTPYGIFELYFGKQQMKLQFVTFDDAWEFKKSSADTIKGGGLVNHCWFIPKDGSKGEEC